MHVELKMPTPTEGEWQLIDGEGKVVANSKDFPGATIIVEPHFYKGDYSQVLVRTRTIGKKGKEMLHAMRVAANTGKVSAENAMALPSKIVPKFDTLTKEAK